VATLTTTLKMITGRQLPRIGWSRTDLDPAKFQPPQLVDLDHLADGTKPGGGGLWCSTVVRAGINGQIVGTAWTCRDRSGGGDFTIVKPHRAAKVVVIDNQADLSKVIARWPDERIVNLFPGLEGKLVRRDSLPPLRVDWPAMAQEIDAVYVTAKAIGELNTPVHGPHLWGWDVPTVLFLRPAFKVGRVVTDAPSADERDAMNLAAMRKAVNRAVSAGKVTRDQGAGVLDWFKRVLTDAKENA